VRRSVSATELRSLSNDALPSNQTPQADYVARLPSYVTPPDTPQMPPAQAISEKDAKVEEMRLPSSYSWKGVSGQITSTRKLSIGKLPSLKPLTTAQPSSPPQVPLTNSSEKSTTANSSSSPPRTGMLSTDSLMVALRGLTRDTQNVVGAVRRLPLPLEGGLARDAVDEAFREMTGFLGFLEYLAGESTLPGPIECRLRDIGQLMAKTRETPMLLALPVLLRVALASPTPAPAISDIAPDTVSGWIGISESEYRQTCLSGFRKADECAAIVGKAFLKNKMAGCLDWMRVWVEKSTREEEEDSDDEDQD